MKPSRLVRAHAHDWPDTFRSQGPTPAAYEHLRRFQALAEAHGDRAAGTSGYEAAAQYVGQQLEGAGYHARRQYFTFKHHGQMLETFNVLAETDAGSAENVIMLGAHLDGVPGCPAINDNGSGSAALIETAKAISQLEGITNKVRFAWWGAEEYKKEYGSRHYVRNLLDNDSEALEAIVAYLNFDMIASPNPIIGVYDARESRPKYAVPDGSTELMDIFTDYFDSRGQPWMPTDWDMDSDQVAFLKAGIAVGGLYTGDDDKKTTKQARRFGGTAKQSCDPNYHQPGDDIHNVDLDALCLMTDTITHTASRLAQDHSDLTQARKR